MFLVVFVLFGANGYSLNSRAFMLVLSPISAVVMYIILTILVFVAYWLPVVKIVSGFAQIVYLWIFCRLVVQPAPEVELPVWW